MSPSVPAGRYQDLYPHFQPASRQIFPPPSFQYNLPGATRRVLNVQLNQLEEHELTSKRIYAELPPKVEYSLTDFGQSVLPVIAALGKWGDDHQEHLRKVIAKI